jgi:hypothetical protein
MHLEIIGNPLKPRRRGEHPALSWPAGELVQRYIQKPSSARPTQLNTKIEQTTAATDAMAAIVFVERMTRTRCEKPILSTDLCSMMARVCHEK